jgi:hypothetical protein
VKHKEAQGSTRKHYDGIPIVRYTHISSAITPFAGYNILISQLHRLQALITKRSSVVLEVAKLMVQMECRGYCMHVLGKRLRHHVLRFYHYIGDMSPHALLTDIWATVDQLQAMRATGADWEHLPPPVSVPRAAVHGAVTGLLVTFLRTMKCGYGDAEMIDIN